MRRLIFGVILLASVSSNADDDEDKCWDDVIGSIVWPVDATFSFVVKQYEVDETGQIYYSGGFLLNFFW